jgi:hypothetical protein
VSRATGDQRTSCQLDIALEKSRGKQAPQRQCHRILAAIQKTN